MHITGPPLTYTYRTKLYELCYRTFRANRSIFCYRTNLLPLLIGRSSPDERENLSDHKYFPFLFAFPESVSYHVGVANDKQWKVRTMNYQTLLGNATNWLFSDVYHLGCVIGAFFVIVAIRTAYKELSGKH